MRSRHLLERGRREQLAAKESALPLQQIYGSGVQEPRGIRNSHADVAGMPKTVRTGFVALGTPGQDGRSVIYSGLRHAERHQDIPLEKVCVGYARSLFDDLAEKDVVGVAVIELRSRLEIERLVANAGDAFLRSMILPLIQVPAK